MNRMHEYYIASGVLFTMFVALGELVIRRPALRVDALALFHAHATPLARFFTWTGRWAFVTCGFIIAMLIFIFARAPLWIPLAVIISQLVTQALAELFKAHYRRVRPDYWLIGLDPGKSYPSGHAVTAMVFFFGWACVAALSTLSPGVRYTIAALLILWIIGIDWSRLALGAHYVTDIAGGTLLGSAWICAALGALHQASLSVP